MKKTRISKLLMAAFIISLLLVGNRSVSASGQIQPMTIANMKGIDVSHWDGTINWVQVKNAGIGFAYVKASDGSNSLDAMFASNVKAARAAKIPIGAYHLARPTAPFNSIEPRLQAQFFVNAMKNNGMADYGDIMPVVDLELPTEPGTLTADQLSQWAQTFVQTVQSLTQRQVMIYTGAWFVEQNHDFGGQLKDLPVWIASWTRYGISQPPAVGGWSSWTAWQYTDQGTVPGVSKEVDLDVGPSSLDGLRGYLSAAASPIRTPFKARSESLKL